MNTTWLSSFFLCFYLLVLAVAEVGAVTEYEAWILF